MLDKLKVNNVCIQASKSLIEALPVPFIAQVRKKGTDFFAAVQSVKDQELVVTSTAAGPAKWTRQSMSSFLEQWTGVVLLAEPAPGAGERDYKKNSQNDQKRALALSAILLIVVSLSLSAAVSTWLSYGMQGIFAIFLLMLKMAGVFITVLLLSHEVNVFNSLLDNVCRPSAKVNCRAVLSSDGAKIGNWLTWSDVGFAYFGGALFTLLAGGMQAVGFLAWLSLLAAPFAAFSVLYQWRKVKQWCLLCLLVQGILLLDLLIAAIAGLYDKPPANSLMITRWALLFLAPGVAWVLLKDYLSLPVQLFAANAQVTRFKQHPGIFKALMSKETAITHPYEGLGIRLGNPEAKHVLIQVCDPTCVHCAAAQPALDRILDEQPEVQVRLLFMATTNSGDKRLPAVRHLLAIAAQGNELLTRKALRDWYGAAIKDYEVFAALYPLDEEAADHNMHIDKLHAWTVAQKVNRTPTYFFDGCQLPPGYNIEDLRYLLAAGLLQE